MKFDFEDFPAGQPESPHLRLTRVFEGYDHVRGLGIKRLADITPGRSGRPLRMRMNDRHYVLAGLTQRAQHGSGRGGRP